MAVASAYKIASQYGTEGKYLRETRALKTASPAFAKMYMDSSTLFASAVDVPAISPDTTALTPSSTPRTRLNTQFTKRTKPDSSATNKPNCNDFLPNALVRAARRFDLIVNTFGLNSVGAIAKRLYNRY